MHFTDTEIKDFEQIARHYTAELIELDRIYEDMCEAEYELRQHNQFYIGGTDSYSYQIFAIIHDCKERIKRMERFEIWLEQNHGI